MARCKAAGTLLTIPRMLSFQEINRCMMHPYESICRKHRFSLAEQEHPSPGTWEKAFALLPSLRYDLPCTVLKSSNAWQAVPALSLHRENKTVCQEKDSELDKH